MNEPSQPAAPALLLAIGDIHLGTRCSGLPDDLSSWGVSPEDLTPAAALEASVEFAVRKRVDAVLFAGDVVESTNARFEAMMPLERAVQRLVGEGIQVIAVAGNHDVEALPRLAGQIDGFTLLGAGGRWESHVIERDGRDLVEIVGWSFGEPVVRQSPLPALLGEPIEGSSGLPRIGLLHGDLNASEARYAPIRQAELDQTGFDAWLLGHIHKPSIASLSDPAAYPSGYLGSLVGLDPTETGPHGPWLVTVSAGGQVVAEHITLAPLRWEQMAVAIDDVQDADDVPDRLLAKATARARGLIEADAAPRALGLRIRIEGASEHYDAIRRKIDAGEWPGLDRPIGDTTVFINKIVDGMDLHLDLAEIAEGADPPALMARQLLMLQRNDAEARELLNKVRWDMAKTFGEDLSSPLLDHRSGTDPLSDAALLEVLLEAGKLALRAMLDQRSVETEA